jgi:HD-GYP domain-containing protein (c-di-GMP phosphodiesterase class II)/DNA-binding CsgD family transcriptional regulator
LVVRLALRLGRELDLDEPAQALLAVAGRVRDIGMLSLPDSVVLATSRLTSEDWALINSHPELGEELLRELPVVAEAAGIVRAHHERWDGGGYPDGCSGDTIPLLSRVIATCDAFVAVAIDRPHRRGMGAAAALELVRQESGSQLDPVTADALVRALAHETRPGASSPSRTSTADTHQRQAPDKSGPTDLMGTILAFDVVPVLAPAYEQLLAAIASQDITGGELVVAIEGDVGLTVAVMRAAQAQAGSRPLTNVADAVVALGPGGIEASVKDLPLAEFPWRTSVLEVLMHGFLVHAQAVARAADRLARELDLPVRDEILVVALLHDVGKLVLSRSYPEYSSAGDINAAPEDRVRREQHAWGMDDVARHHSADADGDVATYVRVADMLAHHAQGHVIDRATLLALAQGCGLSTVCLREILFDLPHSGASHLRRAEPSPLSPRQTEILSLMAQGKQYKAIGLELGLSASTVRSHLHAVYLALVVNDRAQAVLRATEMGWI